MSLVRFAAALLLLVAIAQAFPADTSNGGTSSTTTTTVKPGFYDNARDMLQRFGQRLQTTGTSVKESLQRGYDYSKQRVGAVIQNYRKNETAEVDPMQMAESAQVIVARTADQPLPALIKTDNQTPANNSDSIFFRADDDSEQEEENNRIFNKKPLSVVGANASFTSTSTTTEMLPTENPELDNNSTDPLIIDDRIIIDVPVPADCLAPKQKDKQGRCRTVV